MTACLGLIEYYPSADSLYVPRMYLEYSIKSMFSGIKILSGDSIAIG